MEEVSEVWKRGRRVEERAEGETDIVVTGKRFAIRKLISSSNDELSKSVGFEV